MRYAAVIESGSENFSAYVPDLPGCVVTGKTLSNIRDAVEFHLEGMRADGLPVPEPTTRCEYIEAQHLNALGTFQPTRPVLHMLNDLNCHTSPNAIGRHASAYCQSTNRLRHPPSSGLPKKEFHLSIGSAIAVENGQLRLHQLDLLSGRNISNQHQDRKKSSGQNRSSEQAYILK